MVISWNSRLCKEVVWFIVTLHSVALSNAVSFQTARKERVTRFFPGKWKHHTEGNSKRVGQCYFSRDKLIFSLTELNIYVQGTFFFGEKQNATRVWLSSVRLTVKIMLKGVSDSFVQQIHFLLLWISHKNDLTYHFFVLKHSDKLMSDIPETKLKSENRVKEHKMYRKLRIRCK